MGKLEEQCPPSHLSTYKQEVCLYTDLFSYFHEKKKHGIKLRVYGIFQMGCVSCLGV